MFFESLILLQIVEPSIMRMTGQEWCGLESTQSPEECRERHVCCFFEMNSVFFFLYIGLFSGNLSSVRSKIIITLHLSVIESNSQANNRHKIWKMLMQIGIFYLWSSVANSVTVWCRTRKPPVWFKTLNSPMPVKTVVLTIFVPNARHDFYGYFLLHGMS